MTYSENGLSITADFATGSAGEIRRQGEGRYTVLPKAEAVPDWFYEALQVHYGGAGVPREYAFHVRVTAERDQELRLCFRFTQTNGAAYMDPPYWLKRDGQWWPVAAGDVEFEAGVCCTIRLRLEAGVTVQVANKPYVAGEAVEREMRQLVAPQEGWHVRELGRTAEGRPLLALETAPRPEVIMVNATMQPAEPAARPVLAAAHWLSDRGRLARRALERFQFCFSPLPNPDGAHHGMSVSNGRGEVPMFSFGRYLEGKDAPAETTALWRYVETLRPIGFIEFHTHYQNTRYHKLNPVAAEWFAAEGHGRLHETTECLLGVNDQWRVTELTKALPLVRAGFFANMAERLGTIPYCYQIYALTEQATCTQAVAAVQALAGGLAGRAWREAVVEPEIVPG